MSKNGFTLVELLITITIISFLAAVGLVVYSNVMQQGRNSTRQADLRSIQSALEQYYSDQFFYPTGNLPFGNSLKNTTGNPDTPSPEKIYLNTIPKDPTGTLEYAYTSTSSTGGSCDNTLPGGTKCEKYCLYAKLEGASTDLNGCTIYGSYNYAVTLP